MNTTEFHIKKENQVKSLNKIIQIVKSNGFKQKSKEKVVSLATVAINCINDMRKEVYKALEDFDFDQKYSHNDEGSENITVKQDVKDTRYMESEMCNEFAKIKIEIAHLDSVVNQNTFKKYFKTEKFKANEVELNEALDGLSKAFIVIAKESKSKEEKPEASIPPIPPVEKEKTEEPEIKNLKESVDQEAKHEEELAKKENVFDGPPEKNKVKEEGKKEKGPKHSKK